MYKQYDVDAICRIFFDSLKYTIIFNIQYAVCGSGWAAERAMGGRCILDARVLPSN